MLLLLCWALGASGIPETPKQAATHADAPQPVPLSAVTSNPPRGPMQDLRPGEPKRLDISSNSISEMQDPTQMFSDPLNFPQGFLCGPMGKNPCAVQDT